jgi:ATP-dependent DNA helicase DinG
LSRDWISTRSDFLENFPFPTIREKQVHVLNEICNAFNSGYKYIILEAPTGFGKSPVAVSVAMTLGTSYFCTSTKDLQSQYARDFPFIKVAKGMNNFPCLVKEDLIRNGNYQCGSCSSSSHYNVKNEYCPHTTVDFGPCLIDGNSFNKNNGGCRYKIDGLNNYQIINRGTKEEQIFITSKAKEEYQTQYSQWAHVINSKDTRKEWIPCGYYDQLLIALMSTHSIFNYAMFLRLLPSDKTILPRQLLVLDEGHLLEMEIMKLCEFSISKKDWKKYLDDFRIIDYGYHDIEKWIDFMIELEAKMIASLGDLSAIKQLVIVRQNMYNWKSSNIIKTKTKTKATNTKITDYLEMAMVIPVTVVSALILTTNIST